MNSHPHVLCALFFLNFHFFPLQLPCIPGYFHDTWKTLWNIIIPAMHKERTCTATFPIFSPTATSMQFKVFCLTCQFLLLSFISTLSCHINTSFLVLVLLPPLCRYWRQYLPRVNLEKHHHIFYSKELQLIKAFKVVFKQLCYVITAITAHQIQGL